MQVTELERDVLVVTGEAHASNATVFLSDQGALIVDALASRSDAELLHGYLEQRQIAARLFVLTHAFSDHLAALARFPDVPVLAHLRSSETHLLEQHLSADEAGFYRAPQILVGERADLHWGRHRLELSHHSGHTPSGLVVDVPSADLLISGDIAVGAMAYLKYADVPALERSLAWARLRGRRRIVQGHRGIAESECFQHALDYIRALREWSRGDRLGDCSLEAFLSPEVTGSAFEAFFHQRNLDMVRHGSLPL